MLIRPTYLRTRVPFVAVENLLYSYYDTLVNGIVDDEAGPAADPSCRYCTSLLRHKCVEQG